jgi:ankyrin
VSVEEKPEKIVAVEDEKIKKVVTEEVRESSPKPSAGFFGLFKKSKKDEEETIPSRPPLSDSVVKDITDTSQFLSSELENYHDVKPAKFEPIVEDKVAKVSDKAVESSPKSSRGLFDIFKKPKKEQEEVTRPVISEAALKDINDAAIFLKGEVESYEDVKPAKFEPIKEEKVTPVVAEQTVEASPKSSRGLFSVFKKPKKDHEDSIEAKPVISESVLKEINDTETFLTVEVQNYDVEKDEKEKVTKLAQDVVESSPKSSRGLFGIFKKSKKDEVDEVVMETTPKTKKREKIYEKRTSQ